MRRRTEDNGFDQRVENTEFEADAGQLPLGEYLGGHNSHVIDQLGARMRREAFDEFAPLEEVV